MLLRRAFSDTGQADDVDLALGKVGVTPEMSQRIVTDPNIGLAVAAAMRGDIAFGRIAVGAWIERETNIGKQLAKCGLPMFDLKAVGSASQMDAGIHDRFVPGGLDRKQLLEACKIAGVELYAGNTNGADRHGERILTQAGLFTLDYASIFRPTNATQHPYMLTYQEQQAWITDQGGDGFSTAEEAIYMAFLRPKIELGFLPFSGGDIRCRNSKDCYLSLSIRWNACDGLMLSSMGRSYEGRALWALPRKFRPLE